VHEACGGWCESRIAWTAGRAVAGAAPAGVGRRECAGTLGNMAGSGGGGGGRSSSRPGGDLSPTASPVLIPPPLHRGVVRHRRHCGMGGQASCTLTHCCWFCFARDWCFFFSLRNATVWAGCAHGRKQMQTHETRTCLLTPPCTRAHTPPTHWRRCTWQPRPCSQALQDTLTVKWPCAPAWPAWRSALRRRRRSPSLRPAAP